MTRPHRDPLPDRASERGFVLVGVVMFVLALTILGLSLFNLSSFEAQFLGHSVHDSQAFYYAQGGFDRCKFVLSQTNDLGAVGDGISEATPMGGMVYASAAQDKDGDGTPDDSTGAVEWAPNKPIWLTVRARDRDVTRTLQAKFAPSVSANPYKYLISTFRNTAGVNVAILGPNGASDNRSNTVSVDGRVWQNDHDQSWFNNLAGGAPTMLPARLDSLPIFDVAGFIATHEPFAQPAVYDAGNAKWSVHATGVQYFVTKNADPVTGDFSLRSLGAVSISVRDTAVWLFPRGIRIDGLITVTAANPGACLIIVANKSGTFVDQYGNWKDVGIWVFGGLKSAAVPIIMSSGDQIRYEQVNNYLQSCEVAYLSLYANYIRLMGPQTGGGRYMLLHHTPPYGNDYLVDRLVSQGALPGSDQLEPSSFKLVAGSWQEIGP